jgi:hypothetical protein
MARVRLGGWMRFGSHPVHLVSARTGLVEDRCHAAAHFDELSANGGWGKTQPYPHSCLASRLHASALVSDRFELVEDRGRAAAHFDGLSANGG